MKKLFEAADRYIQSSDWKVIAVLKFCLVSLGMIVFAVVVGIPLASFLYAADFEPLRGAQYLMLVAGGFAAASDFLFQILTVLRQQASATAIYLAAFAFIAIASSVLVRTSGFMGAVYAYLGVMVLLFSLLVLQYIRARITAD